MIVGAHVMIQSSNYDADKAFFRDVLRLPSVDAGGGFLLFGVPPAEIAIHEGKDATHELFLMCDDVEDFIDEMKTRDVVCTAAMNRGWGILTQVTLPSGGKLGVYQPLHQRPKAKAARSTSTRRKTRKSAKASSKRRPAVRRAKRPRAKARKR